MYTDLVLDLGGVLFSYSVPGDTLLKPRAIKHILDSSHWHDYERGTLSKQKCYDNVTVEFGLAPGAWEQTLAQLEATLEVNEEFLKAIKDLKASYPHLHVHAFSNISGPDFELLKPTIEGWAIFDNIVTSNNIGFRKPELKSYQKLLTTAKIQAHRSIFVDDRHENAVAAQSLGLHGILFDDTKSVVNRLHNLLGDPVSRGMEFLKRNSKNLWSESNRGVLIKSNFCQLLILQCIGDREMVTLENEGDIWQFFVGEPAFTDKTYPKDADTTSLAHVTLGTSKSQKDAAMDIIMSYQTSDGMPLMYLDYMRPRFCPPVAANILRFFYLNGQGSKLKATLDHLYRILESKAYEIEDRYYCQPEWLFYYLSDLCGKSSDPDLKALRTLLATRLQERIGCNRDVLAAAMRVLAAQSLDIKNDRDMATLLDTQQLDGGWELTWMWRYGQVDVKMGSRGVPTALAVKAIRNASEAGSPKKTQNRLLTISGVWGRLKRLGTRAQQT